MEYDDEVAFFATQKLHQLSRTSDSSEARPWALTVSFTHPHDPYVARKQYWDLYEDCQELAPRVPPIPYDQMDQHSQRLYKANDSERFDITEDNVRRSRQAYFANISYLDDKIGGILATLEATRMANDTIIVFCSDHGDMLGERGMWFKMSFFEGSARVPLMISVPGAQGRRVAEPTSNLDITPTLAALAGVSLEEVAPWTDGESLVASMDGGTRTAPVLMEYAAEGSEAPLVAIREGSTSSFTASWMRLSCSISTRTPRNSQISRQTRRMPTALPVTWRRSAPAGTWLPMTPRSVRARRGAGWSTRR
jgi:choline-sulfatase